MEESVRDDREAEITERSLHPLGCLDRAHGRHVRLSGLRQAVEIVTTENGASDRSQCLQDRWLGDPPRAASAVW
jgi:hypothetical protein